MARPSKLGGHKGATGPVASNSAGAPAAAGGTAHGWLWGLALGSLAQRAGPLVWLGRWRQSAALAAALQAAGPEEVATIAGLILSDIEHPRGRPALLAVLARWNDLSAEQQASVAPALEPRWPELAAELRTSKRASDRLGLSSFLADRGIVGGASLLVASLGDAHAPVGDAAQRGLEGLVARALAGQLGAGEQWGVLAAADRTIESFDTHRRTGAFRSALKLWPWGLGYGASRSADVLASSPSLTHALGQWMSDEQHPAHMVLRGMIRKGDDPQMRTTAWLWLKHPALRAACVDRLSQPASAAQHAPVLSRAHLLLNPARAAGLAKAKLTPGQIAGMLPKMAETESLPTAGRAGLVRQIEHAPVEARLKDAAWAARLCDQSTLVRLAVVRAAAAARRTPGCLSDLIFDHDPRIALHAATALLARARRDGVLPAERERLLGAIARSPHERLRHLARQCQQGATLTAGAARTRAASSADPVQLARSAIAQLALASTPAPELPPAAAATAAEASSGGEIDSRPRAVLAVQLRREAALVATLVRQLADAPAPSAQGVLISALGVSDARVRANAIEALVDRARHRPTLACDGTIVELLLDHALDPHHRVRANAARGLLLLGLSASASGSAHSGGGGGGAEGSTWRPRNPDGQTVDGSMMEVTRAARRTLTQMLADQRPLHRVAGLWLAERAASALADDADVIQRVTLIDQDPASRAEGLRARRVLERLTVETRGRWQRRASLLDAPAQDQAHGQAQGQAQNRAQGGAADASSPEPHASSAPDAPPALLVASGTHPGPSQEVAA